MKKYLLIAMACLVVGANASENPFDLEENLESIDQEEASLLSNLKRSEQKKEHVIKKEAPKPRVIQPTVIQPTVIQPTVIQPTVVQPTVVTPKTVLPLEDKKAKERAEVEAYEKQRAKTVPETKPVVVAPKVAEVKKPEPAKVVEVVEVKKIEPVKPVEVKKAEPVKIVENDFVADINLTREKEEKARLVDLAYAKAVEEMDRPED